MSRASRTRYRTLGRSVRLFRDFLVEQTDPDRFYTALAEDTLALITRHEPLSGRTVVDVGAGSPEFCRRFVQEGARYLAIDPLRSELAPVPGTAGLVGVGEHLPLRDGCADVVMSNNVMEHVRQPGVVADEMMRVVRPGGLIFISYTAWASPWGGHETSPWHWLGGGYAARRYQRVHGHPPKNVYGVNMYPTRVAPALRWARRVPGATLVEAIPRYHPDWASGILAVPGLREVLTWNLTMILRRE